MARFLIEINAVLGEELLSLERALEFVLVDLVFVVLGDLAVLQRSVLFEIAQIEQDVFKNGRGFG
jgi:hypothetical protein